MDFFFVVIYIFDTSDFLKHFQDAFKEAIFSLAESDKKGTEKFVKSMLEEKRLQMETWS